VSPIFLGKKLAPTSLEPNFLRKTIWNQILTEFHVNQSNELLGNWTCCLSEIGFYVGQHVLNIVKDWTFHRSGTVGKKEERPIMMACFRHCGCQGHAKETHLPSSKPYKLVEIPEPKQMFENPGVDDCILGVVRYMQPILVSCSEPFF